MDFEQPIPVSLSEVISTLVAVVGHKETAYVCGAVNTADVALWTKGEERPGTDAEQRLRLLYRVVIMLREFDAPDVIRAWLIGINPDLCDRSALRVLHEEPLESASQQILSAAKTFIVTG